MDRQFVDAHHHLWDLEKLDYKWLKRIGEPKPFGDPTAIQRTYDLQELRYVDARDAGLVKSVHVQCDPALPDPVSETSFIQQTSDQHDFPMAIVGFVDLLQKDAQSLMERHMQYPSFRGVRQIVCHTKTQQSLCFVQSDLMLNSLWKENYSKLENFNLSFDLQLYPEQVEQALPVLKAHPNISVALNHAGCPFDQSPEGLDFWYRQMEKLAEMEHVFVKISGFGMYDSEWNRNSVAFFFNSLLKLFGTERLMLGSNFPVDKLMKDYKIIWKNYQELISHLSLDEQNRICLKNAEKFYRF